MVRHRGDLGLAPDLPDDRVLIDALDVRPHRVRVTSEDSAGGDELSELGGVQGLEDPRLRGVYAPRPRAHIGIVASHRVTEGGAARAVAVARIEVHMLGAPPVDC